jgi:subtilisin family serine protease
MLGAVHNDSRDRTEQDPRSREVAALLQQAGLLQLVHQVPGGQGVRVALLDGSVDTEHPLFRSANISQIDGIVPREAPASRHATMLASVLIGEQGPTMGLCPNCTLISIPIIDARFAAGRLATIDAATRIVSGIKKAMHEGVDVIQLSVAFDPEQGRGCAAVISALSAAAGRGIVAIVAAGNDAHLAANPILHAPAVVGVAAADKRGLPLSLGVLGPMLSQRGLLAPGMDVPGAGPQSSTGRITGSSVAACFVTGTFALLRCAFPSHSLAEILEALVHQNQRIAAARTIVPRSLNGGASVMKLRHNRPTSNRSKYDDIC